MPSGTRTQRAAGLRSQRPGMPGWQVNCPPDFLTVNPILAGPVGAPKPGRLLDELGKPRYLQTHFVWSIPFRALSTKVDPP